MKNYKYILLAIAACLVLIVCAIIAFNPFHFVFNPVVTTVVCKTQYGPCPEKWQIALQEKFLNKNLFTLSINQIKSTASSLPGAREVRIQKRLNTLQIFIVQSKAYSAVSYETNPDKFTLLDQNGGIINTVSNTPLPIILVHSSITEIPPDQLHFMAMTLALMYENGAKVTAQNIPNGVMITDDQTQIIMPKFHNDPSVLVGSLQFMLARFTIENKHPLRIDMRFKNPVVVFK